MTKTQPFEPQDDWDARTLHTASFRRWMAAQLRETITFRDATSEAVRAATIEALCDRSPELVTWHPDARYRGDDYTNGGWSLNAAALKQLLPKAIEEASRQVDEARHPTLDSYLAALGCGALEAAPPREPHATTVVADPKAFYAALAARRIPCKDCGTLFTRASRSERTCPACKRQRKERRAADAAADQAALQAGARFLTRLLKERAIDPFAFPKDRFLWLTDAAVREWLSTPTESPGTGIGIVGKDFWGLTEVEIRLVRWAYRRRGLWPEDLQGELARRFRGFGIRVGGSRGTHRGGTDGQ